MSVSVKALIKQPFGPFWDTDILSDACKSTKSRVLPLRSVMLARNNKPTGLTECEFGQPECKKNNKRHPVLVRGVLEIKKLAWLTERGQRAVLEELRKRDEAVRGTSAQSLLTLANVYNLKLALKVWIQCTKSLPAVHMRNEAVPDGLFIKCDDRGRFYHVVSMEQETYRLSQAYLARFRLHRELKDILDAYEKKHKRRPLLSDRTPEWFLTEYLRGRPELFSRQGSRSNGEDEDLQDFSDDSDASNSPAARAQRLRKTANSVRKFFYTHSYWLEGDAKKQRRDKLIDPGVWKLWRLKRYRASASPPPLQRDQASSEDEDAMDVDDVPSDDDMDVDDEPRHMPRNKRRSSTSIEHDHNKRRRRETTIRSPTPPPTPPPDFGVPDEEVSSYDSDESFQAYPVPRRSTSLEYMSDPGVQPAAQNGDEGDNESSYDEDEDIESDEPDGHQYDSDFSGDSPLSSDVPSDSDRGDDEPDRPLSPTPPDVLAAIPLALRDRIIMPRSGDVWRCPVRSHDLRWCPFKIDLYRCEMDPAAMLARGDLLSNDQMRRLRALGWSWGEKWVQDCFGKIVAAHYEWHINELGISYIQRGERSKFEWKYPQPSTHARVIRRVQNAVKTEGRQSAPANGDVRVKEEPGESSSRQAPWS